MARLTKGQVSWLLPIVTAAAVVAVGAVSFPFTVDDAFLVARYARSLLADGSYAAFPGGAPTDGITGPLWLVPAILDELVGRTDLAITKAFGLACAALAAWLVVAACARRVDGGFVAPAAAALIAVQPTLGLWGSAGLETGLATLLFTIAVLAAGIDRPRPVACGGAIALLAWTRPELGIACAALLGWLAMRAGSGVGTLSRREFAAGLALAAGSAIALTVVRALSFGDPLPLAAYAKPGEIALGARYVGGGVLVTTSGVGLALAAIGAKLGGARERAAAVAIGTHLLAVIALGGDWMPGFRLFAPVLPLYAWLAARGGWLVFRRRRRVAIALVTLAAVVPALDLIAELPRAHQAGALRESNGRTLASELHMGETVAIVDAGFVPYVAGVATIDLAGLTDRTIAHSPGGYLAKRIDPAYLERRAPDVIVLHSGATPRVVDEQLVAIDGFPVEQRVASMPWVRAQFRVVRVVPYAPGYTYVVLRRRL